MHEQEKDEALVDLRTVRIDTTLPVEERARSYLRQVKNPYCCRVGSVVVHMAYAENGPTLDECFSDLLDSL